MELILFLKEKKKVKLWQSIFLVLLNFSILKNKKKNINNFKYDTVNYNINTSKVLKIFSLLRIFSIVRSKFLRLYLSLKSSIFLLSKVFLFLRKYKKYIGTNITNLSLSNINSILSLLSFNKNLYFYLTVIKYLLVYLNILNDILLQLNKNINFY